MQAAFTPGMKSRWRFETADGVFYLYDQFEVEQMVQRLRNSGVSYRMNIESYQP